MDRPKSQPDSPSSDNLTSPDAQPERFVDASALAKHLSVMRRQVLEMTRRGVIPGHPLGIGTSRRVWRYKISEVEAAIASSGRKPPVAKTASSLPANSTPSMMPVGSSRSQRRKL